mmetsp:Transcript_29530/g.67894  ORF Transcript_29530/g.67894 Transcript_29530/m.67894 type:complete len:152 (-) Transcript_29530:279-734(-)|eukprot:CAMPEP_0113302420 /NCGR_PEP_ID=MMETSP0010_2-20120614/3239_1 /TAXON_ID=216773 ORGANISM="Corethron hystrix, Strain 308" /NCGR_SAMPLE_ID=MMETSP0010_2 /ASSEMBLY_ACC=CAM_ASM_000155 /LENGTH=151 /DNA_ID=CAMNT_0000156205 /DNA_START=31 /DNA_END=486 /DNA_ORIENTATION=+ /assembly_acc=CAM_ASM_000155
MIIYLILTLAATAFGLSTAAYPSIRHEARVKQHRSGANGDLVDGEEEMRKIIVYWDIIPDAVEYELCYGCVVDNKTGIRHDDPKGGHVFTIGISSTCGGVDMCKAIPNANLGKNVFNVRVKTNDGRWSRWSEGANFIVDEPGFSQHVYDEL